MKTIQTCPSEWVKTTYNQIFEIAETMGVKFSMALAMRHNYLDEKIAELRAGVEDDFDYLETCEDELEFRIWLESAAAKLREINRLERSRPYKPQDGDITDEMIEQARQYPIDQLVELSRGKMLCFAHTEKTPSMTFNHARNKLHCFGCGWDGGPIDILRERDGMDFISAVKALQ